VLAIVFIPGGLYLLRGVPHIIRFAYPKDDPESDELPDA
jgi:hypothetical protein